MIRLAVLGAGRWGPNLLRTFVDDPRSEVRWVCDPDPARRRAVAARYPGLRVDADPTGPLADRAVDAVVVATPTSTHHRVVRDCLRAGKHVLAEKPLATTADACRELGELALSADRTLLVGHVFLYNPAVLWVADRIASGALGAIRYLTSVRANRGPVRDDVSVGWDLASQDLAIFRHWLGSPPAWASAVGGRWLRADREDCVFATLGYPDGVLAHLRVSWVEPRKTRLVTAVGDRRTIEYDDLDLSEPVREHVAPEPESGPGIEVRDTFGSFRAGIVRGAVEIPRIELGEPLRRECEHFLDCIEHGTAPRTGAAEALEIVRVLEALDRSLVAGGHPEPV